LADDVIPTAIRAGVVAVVLSGAPSTLHALATGRDPLEASRAAGSLVLPRETRTQPLMLASAITHTALSLGWATVLSRVLPRGHERSSGALAGLAIAAIDLGVVGRRYPRIRDLHVAPQLADHIAFGLVVGTVLASQRARNVS
jgi:hypothetical protein